MARGDPPPKAPTGRKGKALRTGLKPFRETRMKQICLEENTPERSCFEGAYVVISGKFQKKGAPLKLNLHRDQVHKCVSPVFGDVPYRDSNE